MKSPKTVLEFRDVTFGYRNPLLFTSLSLQIRSGERIAVVGPNGSGKSTLVRLALGIDAAKTGQVFLFGKQVAWHRCLPQVGYIGDISHSDDGLGLPLWLTVSEAVKIHKLFLGSSLSAPFEKMLFEHLSLEKLSEQRIGALSAGERRKLMAYLALSKGPALLIADEATEIIFEEDRPVLIQCVKDACEQFGTAVLWISHDSDSTAQIAEIVYSLQDGRLQPVPDPVHLVTIHCDNKVAISSAMRQRIALDHIRRTIKEQEFAQLNILVKREHQQEKP